MFQICASGLHYLDHCSVCPKECSYGVLWFKVCLTVGYTSFLLLLCLYYVCVQKSFAVTIITDLVVLFVWMTVV
jgi:hypothetical protein